MAAAVARQRVSGGGAETHFAKKLASNEKTIRDRAVKKLRVWISSRRSASSGLCETDMLKLWKGLFYCMWMSDKPKVQEELAETMAQLLHSFHGTSEALNFLAGFFKTMFREWHGIDRLRLDKFYLLIRKFIYESIVLLKNQDWDDRTISLFNDTLRDGPLMSTDKAVPEGVQSHVIQVYIDELFKVDSSKIPSCVFLKLLEPFCHLLAVSKSKVITRVISENIFDALMEKLEKSEEKVVFSALAEQLFTLASRQDIPARNRNILYDYLKKFRKFSQNNTGDMNAESGVSNGVPERCANGHDETLDEKDAIPMGSLPNIAARDHEGKVVGNEDPIVKGADDCDPVDVNDTEVLAKKPKGKKVRKRKCKEPGENKTILGGCFTSLSTDDVETSGKTKRSKSDKIEIPEEMNGEKVKSKKGEKKRKKRKSKVIACADKEHCVTYASQAVADDTELPQEESDLLDGSYLSTLPVPKQKLLSFGRKSALAEARAVEMTEAVPYCKEEAKQDSNDVNTKNTNLISSTETETNGRETVLSALTNKDTVGPVETRLAPRDDGQLESRQESEDFNGTPDSPPLAMFLRHSVVKAKMNTEPKKNKDRKRSVHGQANSAPGNRKKQVRIELSQNTSNTIQDYRRSLVSSPVVPYDATKKPVQSSLKNSPITHALASKSYYMLLRSPRKRASAADFF